MKFFILVMLWNDWKKIIDAAKKVMQEISIIDYTKAA